MLSAVATDREKEGPISSRWRRRPMGDVTKMRWNRRLNTFFNLPDGRAAGNPWVDDDGGHDVAVAPKRQDGQK
jgi:hypothetical protein